MIARGVHFGVKPENPTLYVGLNLSFDSTKCEWLLATANPNGLSLKASRPDVEFVSIPVRRIQHSIGSVPMKKQFGVIKGQLIRCLDCSNRVRL